MDSNSAFSSHTPGVRTLLVGVFTNTQNWQYCHIFSPLFAPSDVSKCRIRYQWGLEDKTSRLQTLLVLFFHNSIAKTILVKLAFLYYREFVKNSIDTMPFNMPSPYIFARIHRICHRYAFIC